MGKRKLKEGETFLDLTPLIDIILQLLIFFVLTTAFIPFAIKVDLPKSRSSLVREENLVVITLTSEGRLFWGKEAVSSEELLRRIEEKSDSFVYLIRGDKGVKYGNVIELLNMLRKKGVEKVGLAVEPED
ncbi:MAG: biopolymer transporter ExbD [Synergistetes bacterium]|nr:MAG: hypothetical protein XD52_0721 [bacterium 42_11]MBC7332352.1 biopolymer transporter ExbD [Synergistota bacterium]MDK2871999.1 biopolymer transport protein TolR [bacterium]